MARRSLAELKSAFKDTTTPQQTNGNSSNYYSFYRMDFDEKAVVRFLPDKNEDNPLGFLVEKRMHVLNVNGTEKTVPCLSMYGNKACPICDAAKAFYSEEGKDSINGKRLYRKRQHIGQVMVVSDPLPYKDDETPALGTVKLINISWTLMSKIDEAIADDELDEVPYFYKAGTDFIIKRTKKGEYANYESSKFDRNPRDLTEDQIAVAEAGIVDLSTVLPREPELIQIQAWLDADLNGTTIDDGDGQSASSRSAPPLTNASSKSLDLTPPATPSSDKVSESTSSADDGDNVDDADAILRKIRERRNAASAQ